MWMQRWRGRAGERGQSIVIFALSAVALMGMTGLAVDVGNLFSTKAKLTRAADAGALAGVQSFPDVSEAVSVAVSYVGANEPGASATASQVGIERKLRVTATKSVQLTFLRVLGVGPVTVQSTAVAGFGGTLDAVLVIDSTGSMSGQPMTDAKNAAKLFIDMLLPDPSGNSLIGMAPYKNCYNPPGNAPDCINANLAVNLTNDVSALKSKINSLSAGQATNICTGIWKGKQILFGPGSHSDPKTMRVMVLLSDGDNNPHHSGYPPPKGNPSETAQGVANWPGECDAEGDNDISGGSCNNTDIAESTLDLKTYQLAQSLKAQGVEIWVVGLSVCGSFTSAPCNPSAIGSGHDNSQDHNMLKCIASSAGGTNDHYFYAPNSSQLKTIYQAIGGAIVTRLTE